MPKFAMHCLDRKTGKERTVSFDGDDEADAVRRAEELGFIVARVTVVSQADGANNHGEAIAQPLPHSSPAAPTAVPVPPRPARACARMRFQGLLLIVGGVIVVGFAWMMDTTVSSDGLGSRTHNIGLLNRQLVVMIGGCSMAVAGLLLRGLGNLGNDVCESLRRDR